MTNHRTALVTGATRGIGLALARRLAASGWSVVGIARHASDDFPGRLLCCDLADPAQTAETLRGLLSESAVDALVNNAGIALPQSLENLDLAALQQVFDLNVRVAVQLAQACLPGLKRSPAGRIVNLCSRAIHGARERTAYAAAKSALVGVTRTWALELAPLGITVNAVAPGPIETELFRQTRPVGGEEERRILDHPHAAARAAGRSGRADRVPAQRGRFVRHRPGDRCRRRRQPGRSLRPGLQIRRLRSSSQSR